MSKKIVTCLALLLVLAGAGTRISGAAQEPAQESLVPAKAMDSYKVEFTVSELQNGKKINSRSYWMQIGGNAGLKWSDIKRLRVGTRVPVSMGGDQFQYIDVGMNIDCRLLPVGNGKIEIGTNWEYSSVGAEQERSSSRPAFRTVRSDVETVVALDKPTVLSEVDDVASTSRYVFEVRVTKITP